MGKKDKHILGSSRNNPIFKVVGGKAGKAKNKAQEVNTKLKKINVTKKSAGQLIKEVTEKLDTKFTDLQKKSVPFSGTCTKVSEALLTSKLKPITGTLSSTNVDVDSIVNNFETNI